MDGRRMNGKKKPGPSSLRHRGPQQQQQRQQRGRGQRAGEGTSPLQRGESWNNEQRIDAKTIINMAADGPGFFYYDGVGDAGDEIWDAGEHIRSLFSYLAASDAIARIREIDSE